MIVGIVVLQVGLLFSYREGRQYNNLPRDGPTHPERLLSGVERKSGKLHLWNEDGRPTTLSHFILSKNRGLLPNVHQVPKGQLQDKREDLPLNFS